MYSESATDGGSQFAGGGFVFSQGGAGGANNNDSSFSPSRSSKRSQNTGLLPVTVKQLATALQKPSDDNFYVDGQEVNNITLVGMIHDKEEKQTDVTFHLDDFTGRIEVRKWIDGQDSEELRDLRKLRNKAYVRVHGHLRSFQGKRNVVAFSIRLMEDFNEVTFHFLECIYVHIAQTKESQGAGMGLPGTPATTGVYGAPPPSASAHTQGVRSATPHNQYGAPPSMSANGNTMSECQMRVQAIFEEPNSMRLEAGLPRDEVMRRMVGFTQQQVWDAIEFLVNEGLIYSTIDEDHHKSAAC